MIMRAACYAAGTPMPRRHPIEVPAPSRTAALLGMAASRHLVFLVAVVFAATPLRAQNTDRDTDRIDITGRQNLTLGSGARAYGMGGAFLARADDATAASWNPAGLSYLRLPEVSLVGAFNSFDISRGLDTDSFNGRAIDFAAFTWPIALGETRGAVQISYQRSVSFDGRRRIEIYAPDTTLKTVDTGNSNGGFDVIAVGTGLRLTRALRAGFTVNRWLNGYEQTLDRTLYQDAVSRPYREFYLDFRPKGWSFNFGLMWSPVETLNVGAVYKTSFSSGVQLDKTRSDSYGTLSDVQTVTTNAYSTRGVRLDFPASYGFGLSWRPRETLTLSADFTVTRWSRAVIYDYFDLPYTPLDSEGVALPNPPPNVYPQRQYPNRTLVPTSDDPQDSTRLNGQQDKQELRAGLEWVLIKGPLKVPLRAGYFNESQITPYQGNAPRFNGFTAGVGIAVGPALVDFAYIYEFGSYYIASEAANATGDFGGVATVSPTTQRNALKTNRVFASVIYRFSGRP
jgi:hypothetical protein